VNKRSLLPILLVVLMSALVMTSVAGCSRPKPEPRLTPTVEAVEPAETSTPEAVATQVVIAPTVITTIPTQPAGQPTAAPAQTEAGATPTLVVIPTAPAVQPTPAATQEEWFLYTIQRGDTLYSLAARYNTSVEAISALNNISRPDEIQAGMQIKMPKSGSAPAQTGTTPATTSEYIVQAGDDLGSIASRFNVTADAIVKANGLANPDFIYVGQKLVIPAAGQSPSAPAAEKIHTVKPGESIDMIASIYGTTRQAIVSANNLANPNWIYVGQKLRIP